MRYKNKMFTDKDGKTKEIIKMLYSGFTFLQFWITRILMKLNYLLFHIPLMILFWRKGKTVPPIENDLLLLSAAKVADKIRKGELKSEDVVKAYIRRIIEVNPIVNGVAEYRFQKAIDEAKEVDALMMSGDFTEHYLKEEKPLLGVPLTVKVLLDVKGLPNTGASLLYQDAPLATQDASTVALLKKAGAIVLATTNAAELGFGLDTINPLYGRTGNPYDTHRTAGGSSGGEAALLGSAASLIGLGNDLFGSVRVPAYFTGIFAHKPSHGLVSNGGSNPSPSKWLSNFLETGPMCRYVEDLITMMQILSVKSTGKYQIGKPVDFKKLKIFYQINLLDPKAETVDKEISDSMKTAIDSLTTKYGVVAEEVNIKLLGATCMIAYHLLQADIPNLINFLSRGKVSHFNGVLELIKVFIGKPKYSLWTIMQIMCLKVPFLYNKDLDPYYRNLLQKLDNKFDSLLDENSIFIFPTFPFTAPRYYELFSLIFNSFYAGTFNFLGLPATQCPLGLNKSGMPLGVQIIARKNNDALTLACAEELSKVFGGWIPPS